MQPADIDKGGFVQLDVDIRVVRRSASLVAEVGDHCSLASRSAALSQMELAMSRPVSRLTATTLARKPFWTLSTGSTRSRAKAIDCSRFAGVPRNH